MKNYKTIIAVLVLIMALALLAACGGGSSSKLVGTWKPTKIEMGGVEVDLDQIPDELKGMIDVSLQFKEDGSVIMISMGTELKGTYEEKSNTVAITIEGDTQEVSFNGSELVLEQAGVAKITFKK